MRAFPFGLAVTVLLVACDAGGGDTAGDTGENPAGGRCLNGPSVTITSPESSSSLPIGQEVALVAEAESEVDDENELRVLWAVVPNGGNADNVGVGLVQSWTPTEAGIWSIIVQVEDSCTDDPTYNLDPSQDDVRVEVE
jgi:hypothetical protein